jgi:cell division protein FtsB
MDAEKRISLTVDPQGADSNDIRVEVKEHLSAKKKRGYKFVVAFVFFVMFVRLIPMTSDVISYYRMKRHYEELKLYNQELKAIQQQLEAERESLYAPAMIERLAREELDLVFPGESKVYNAIPTEDMPRREGLKDGEKLH